MIFCSHHQSYRFMNKSEQSEGEDGVDMISNLPDDVLQLILSCLQEVQGTEAVNRTSILSRRWRYLWTSVPSIDIEYVEGLLKLDWFTFLEFVYWVLRNKPQDLDSFRLWCGNFYDMLTISQWIHAAVMRKVKLLDLMFRPKVESEDIEILDCLVTCDSLEVLKLYLLGCPLRLPNNITGFQALRVLELREVNLFEEYDVVEYFLETCPLLEDLSLIDCRAYALIISCSKLKNLRIDTQQLVSDEETASGNLDLDWRMCMVLKISCPKLECMKLIGYVAMEFHFDSLYSLKKVAIHAEELFEREVPPLDFFDEISHVESLSISVYSMGQLYESSCDDDSISLPNLKTLELIVDGDNMYELVPFLVCLEDLESLHLIIPEYVYGLEEWHEDDDLTICVLTRHLKKVKFLEFDEDKPRLDVARALLEHGSLLEEMVFSWSDEARFHERSMETLNEVSKFHMASSTVKITAVFNPS